MENLKGRFKVCWMTLPFPKRSGNKDHPAKCMAANSKNPILPSDCAAQLEEGSLKSLKILLDRWFLMARICLLGG